MPTTPTVASVGKARQYLFHWGRGNGGAVFERGFCHQRGPRLSVACRGSRLDQKGACRGFRPYYDTPTNRVRASPLLRRLIYPPLGVGSLGSIVQ